MRQRAVEESSIRQSVTPSIRRRSETVPLVISRAKQGRATFSERAAAGYAYANTSPAHMSETHALPCLAQDLLSRGA
jgi:hypothetical protein